MVGCFFKKTNFEKTISSLTGSIFAFSWVHWVRTALFNLTRIYLTARFVVWCWKCNATYSQVPYYAALQILLELKQASWSL